MKKWIPVLLVLCLLLAPMSEPVSADDHEFPSAVPVTQIDVEPAADLARLLSRSSVFEPGTVPADTAATDAISLPLHALVLSMVERGLDYDAESDLFIWNALYYTLSLYGQVDERAALTEEALILPSEVVLDYLSALFTRHSGLPALPAQLSDRVRYDEATDCYLLALGDFGLTELRVGPMLYTDRDTCLLEGSLIATPDGGILCSFRATLLKNDSMFGFSILDLAIA